MTYRGTIIDGALLAALEEGDRGAVRHFAGLAAEHLAPELDDVTGPLVEALRRIARGDPPNAAFRWDAPQAENETWLLWSLAHTVARLARREGIEPAEAVTRVAGAAELPPGRLAEAVTRYGGEPVPRGLFLTTPGEVERLRGIEARIAAGAVSSGAEAWRAHHVEKGLAIPPDRR